MAFTEYALCEVTNSTRNLHTQLEMKKQPYKVIMRAQFELFQNRNNLSACVVVFTKDYNRHFLTISKF